MKMDKKHTASRGFAPLTPTWGSASGPRWGLHPRPPVIGSRSSLAMVRPPPSLVNHRSATERFVWELFKAVCIFDPRQLPVFSKALATEHLKYSGWLVDWSQRGYKTGAAWRCSHLLTHIRKQAVNTDTNSGSEGIQCPASRQSCFRLL